jgi:hypothetical protein
LERCDNGWTLSVVSTHPDPAVRAARLRAPVPYTGLGPPEAPQE